MSKRVIVLSILVTAVAWGYLTYADTRPCQPTATPAATAAPEPWEGGPVPTPGQGMPAAAMQATWVAYDALAQHTDDYIGRAVYYEGRISQVVERSGTHLAMQVEVTYSPYDAWDDMIYVSCECGGLSEGELIRLWGVVQGRTTYRGALGNQVTLPGIEALVVEGVTP